MCVRVIHMAPTNITTLASNDFGHQFSNGIHKRFCVCYRV